MNMKVVNINGVPMVGEGIGYQRIRRVTGLEI